MPWQKGQSGNPGGRPKGVTAHLSAMIAELSGDGRAMVEFAWGIYTDPNALLADRKWAHDWLTDRWAGKAPQSIELQANVQTQNLTLVSMANLEKLPAEKLFELESILSEVTGQPLLLKPADE